MLLTAKVRKKCRKARSETNRETNRYDLFYFIAKLWWRIGNL